MTRDYRILELLTEYLHVKDIKIQPVSGGDINDAYKIMLPDKTLFLKVNSKELASDMFEQEKIALHHMKQVVEHVPTPKVVLNSPTFSCLLMSYIATSNKMSKQAQVNLAKNLATLHSCRNPRFGYECDNYIGTLRQCNSWKSTWSEFYIQNRLEPQVKLAADHGLLNTNDIRRFQSLYLQVEKLLSAQMDSSLLHGDFWDGNYLIDTAEQAWLIDPAIYFGDCEVDIAMSRLFGGFSEDFYTAYHDLNPLRAGFRDRLPIYQLYYLLVHLNLFGSSYYESVKSILNRQ